MIYAHYDPKTYETDFYSSMEEVPHEQQDSPHLYMVEMPNDFTFHVKAVSWFSEHGRFEMIVTDLEMKDAVRYTAIASQIVEMTVRDKFL